MFLMAPLRVSCENQFWIFVAVQEPSLRSDSRDPAGEIYCVLSQISEKVELVLSAPAGETTQVNLGMPLITGSFHRLKSC